MFNVEVRLTVGGRQVNVDGFVEALLAEIRKAARGDPSLGEARPGMTQRPAHPEVEERKRIAPLAVGINEAAKMLGISPWTLRLYVGRGALRATHVGRRVLIPMEVLEKVTLEGVKRKECVKKPLL